MKKLFFVASLSLFAVTSNSSWAVDKKVFENAVGFMVGGDKMYDDVSSYSSDGCTLEVKFGGEDSFLKMSWNFDLAYWNSARTYTKNGWQYFAVNGDEGVYTGSHLNQNGLLLMNQGIKLGARSTAEFGMPDVTLERFMNAARDLQKQCPGKQKSAY